MSTLRAIFLGRMGGRVEGGGERGGEGEGRGTSLEKAWIRHCVLSLVDMNKENQRI